MKPVTPTPRDLRPQIDRRTKSLVWKSEYEWRLLWRRDDTKRKILKAPISENAIECVYIGENASKSAEADIRSEVKQKYPSAKIFKAKKQVGAFALDFEPLDA